MSSLTIGAEVYFKASLESHSASVLLRSHAKLQGVHFDGVTTFFGEFASATVTFRGDGYLCVIVPSVLEPRFKC